MFVCSTAAALVVGRSARSSFASRSANCDRQPQLQRCRVSSGAGNLTMARQLNTVSNAALKPLRWSELEDRAAYQPLPQDWAGENTTMSPADALQPVKDEPPSEVLGQPYERPQPLEPDAESDAAFNDYNAMVQPMRARELSVQASKRSNPKEGNTYMSNSRDYLHTGVAAVEYWNR